MKSIRFSVLLTAVILILAQSAGAAEPRELTIDSFASLVKQYSKDLKLAQKDREEADAQKSEAISLALPHVSAQASYTRNLSDTYMYMDLSSLTGEDGIMKVDANRNNEYAAGVSLRQTLFSPTVFNAIEAAKQYRKMTDYIYDATYQQIMTLAKQAFSQTLLLEKVVEVAAMSEQNAYDNYIDTKNKFDNGLASEFELLQAESRYRERVPTTASAKRNLDLALIDLKNLAGIPVDTEIKLIGSLDTYPDMPTNVGLDIVLEQRPDYNALLWEERLRKTDVSAQRSAYFPSLSAVAGYGYAAQSNDFKLEEENNSWTVGLVLSVPIFQGGETRARVRQANVRLEKSRLELSRFRDDVEKQLQGVKLRLTEAHARIASAKASLETANKAFSIAEKTSKVGLTTQLELKDARVAKDQATVGYYSAVFEYLAAWYDWQRISGAMTESDS
ncbi:MAG: TolC family protein [Candidatus Zixiibacteriota bacterium]